MVNWSKLRCMYFFIIRHEGETHVDIVSCHNGQYVSNDGDVIILRYDEPVVINVTSYTEDDTMTTCSRRADRHGDDMFTTGR